MKIGVIGAGRVGTSVAKYISENTEHLITGFYSRTLKSAEESADFCNTKAFSELSELLMSSDTLFITVSDSEIKNVWDCIDKTLVRNKIICHFSGSLSSDVFTEAYEYGAYTGSIHPVYAFSSKFSSYKLLKNAFFTLEGCGFFLQRMESLLESTGNKAYIVSKEKKPLYHAALAMASNNLMGLLYTSTELLKECGFSEKDSYALIAPLMLDNLKNALANGAEQALTGAIERGDVSTVEKHLNVLDVQSKEIYKALGIKVLEISELKNKDKPQLSEKYELIERVLLK